MLDIDFKESNTSSSEEEKREAALLRRQEERKKQREINHKKWVADRLQRIKHLLGEHIEELKRVLIYDDLFYTPEGISQIYNVLTHTDIKKNTVIYVYVKPRTVRDIRPKFLFVTNIQTDRFTLAEFKSNDSYIFSEYWIFNNNSGMLTYRYYKPSEENKKQCRDILYKTTNDLVKKHVDDFEEEYWDD